MTNHLARSGALIEHMCHAIFETAKYEKDEELEAILYPKRGSLSYANAGHDLPYLRRRGGGCEELRARGMPLGLMLGMGYEQKEIVLDTGEAQLSFGERPFYGFR